MYLQGQMVGCSGGICQGGIVELSIGASRCVVVVVAVALLAFVLVVVVFAVVVVVCLPWGQGGMPRRFGWREVRIGRCGLCS